MRQDFSVITEDKLSELFPILLENHDPMWTDYYRAEKEFLISIFDDMLLRINHIGSTSVPGLVAKPTIDILLEISKDADISGVTERLKDEGYIINTPKKDVIMFLKGYTPRGFEGQCVHIHVRYLSDWDELYFRDYLILHPEIAHEYEKLKVLLKDQYTYDRDGYTEAKGDFVTKYSEYARKEFPNKYNPENI